MKWINIKDQLPDTYENMCPHDAVLVCVINNKTGPSYLWAIARWYEEGWDILGDMGAHSCTGFYELKSEQITHWMLLPNPWTALDDIPIE